MRKDATVEGSQLITKGTKVLLAYDWEEVDAQPFTITEAYGSLYTAAGVIAVAEKAGEVEEGINGVPRTQVILTAAETGALVADDTYYLLWRIVLQDSQTRLVRAPVRVRGS